MNVPNVLTAIRLILVPVFLFVFFSGYDNSIFIAIIIFLAAGLTDILDGYIARKFAMVTKWGAVLDPLADKLMAITVLISLTIKEILPFWVFFVISLKEIVMIAGAAILFNKGAYISSRVYGKISTVLLYVSILTLELISRSLGLALIYITVFSSLFALYKYFQNFKILHKKVNQ